MFPADVKINKLQLQTPNQLKTNQTHADVSIQLSLILTKNSYILLLVYIQYKYIFGIVYMYKHVV